VRFLIVSDLHANLEALRAVLADCAGEYEQVICCGDLVGYNPDPKAIVEWSVAHCHAVVRGNHDKVVAGIDDIEWFNPVAQTAARWTRQQLEPAQVQYLFDLPKGPLVVSDFQVLHGAPFDEDEYVMNAEAAMQSFASLDLPVAFFGHTHVQGGFLTKRRHLGQIRQVHAADHELALEIEPDAMYLINPGSVGQPRDGDPRAAYALYEPEARLLKFRRVDYPISLTSEKIISAGLPDVLALRLFQGQ
jgi:predicted phosphodiesterase